LIETKETATALLKMIQADARLKIEQAGGTVWSRIGDDDDGVTLVVKVVIPPGTQTKMTEFVDAEE